MEQSPEPPGRQPEQELFQELTEFLRQKNKKPKWYSFINRPAAVAVMGGLIVTGITQFWQWQERRSSRWEEHRNQMELQYQRTLTDRKFELLRTFPQLYEEGGSVLNACLVRRLWLASEQNKPDRTQDTKRITDWSQDLKKSEEAFGKAVLVEAVLEQIHALFVSGEVRSGAAAIRVKWDKLLELNDENLASYNTHGKLSETQIGRYNVSREKIMGELNVLVHDLVRAMGAELSDAHPTVK